MFANVGWGEILVLIVVGLVVLGPERLPGAIRWTSTALRQARDYLRVFLASAHDEVPDKQGRLSIPATLRGYAGLDREVAVIGVPDAEFGQRLRALVVPAHGHTVDPEALRDLVRQHLARHKVPREVVVVDHLPRNTTGKLLRRSLGD